MQAGEETSVTEIEIGSDGRIYIFGASREVLELMRDIGFEDEHLRTRLAAMSQLNSAAETENQSQTENHS